MNIKLPIAELKPALVGLGKIISKRVTLPVLGTVKIDRTSDGWITLTGTDLDSFVTVRLEEPTKGAPVSMLVPYEDLSRLTKRCSAHELLIIEKSEGDKALIQYPIGNQTGEEHVESLPVEDFPLIPRLKSDTLPLNNSIRSALSNAFECASTDETRLELNGAYVDVSQPQCHQVVGTDGRHLFSSNSFNLPLAKSIIIPNHKFLGCKEFNSDGEWQLRVEVKKKKEDAAFLQVSSRRWRFITKQIDGNYPNYRQAVPPLNAFKTNVEFGLEATKEIVGIINRLPGDDGINHRIDVEMTGGTITFIGHTEEKPTSVQITGATAQGPDVSIALNRHYLIRALRFGLCKLQIVDARTALRFSDDAGRQMIVSPINSKAPEQSKLTKPAAPVVSESIGSGSVTPVHSETHAASTAAPTTERKTTMVNDQNSDTSDSNPPAPKENTIEESLELIESLKITFQDTLTSLKELGGKLKTIQRERKINAREMQTFRNSIRTLQKL